jgi:hypothetical protein
MKPVSYDQIESNIADVDVEGSRVKVTWKCPVSGEVVGESFGTMQIDQTQQVVKRGVARTFQIDFMKHVMGALGSVFGKNALGLQVTRAVAAPLASGAARSMTKVRFSEGARRQAIAAAFKPMASKFEWDEDRGQYIAVKKAKT